MADQKSDNPAQAQADSERNTGAETEMQKISEKLKECEREREEYLAGWKRAKADALNESSRLKRVLEQERDRSIGECVLSLLPVFDAVSIAVSQESEEGVSSGIVQVHAQCLATLKSLGAEIIDPVGEVFDPHSHQAVGNREIEEGDKNDTVVEVVRIGVRIGDSLVRPAMVYVGKCG